MQAILTDADGQPRTSGRGVELSGVGREVQVREGSRNQNLIVPVVGNFCGPQGASRRRRRTSRTTAPRRGVLVSNVESYLHRDGSWPAFCANVATMPLDESSVFIRPSAIRTVVNGQALQIYNNNGNVMATVDRFCWSRIRRRQRRLGFRAGRSDPGSCR